MKVAFVGCGHGQLDLIYSQITGQAVDLLIVCGDFEVNSNNLTYFYFILKQILSRHVEMSLTCIV